MTRSQADELSAPVVRAYLDAEDEILRMIAEQLAADGDLSDTSKWRIRQLARAGMIDKRAIEIIRSYMPVVSAETDELITAAAMSEIAYVDSAFSRAAADGVKGLGTQIAAEATAFKVMKRFRKQARHDLNLVNTVMGYKSRQTYRKAVNSVYDAVHHELGRGTASVIMGQESLQAAVRSTIRRMSKDGVPVFVDKAGREWSAEAYITMDLRTTAMNTARQAQFDRCDDYGIDLIEVSSHLGARPLCAPYQGRIYSRGGASGSTKDGAGRTIYYSPLSQTSYGEPAGLFGINCGHQCYPFVPGANIQRYFPYDDEENAKAYEKSQVQRKLERDIRASKRECMMLDAAGDKEGYTKAAQRLKTRREKYKAYCKQNGLGTQNERTQVYGFDRSQSSKATWAARKSSADKGLTNGAASGKIKEKEYGIPYGKKYINADMEYINSPEYAAKFNSLTDNPAVNKTFLECSRKAIGHRSGTLQEDFYVISLKDGTILGKQVESTAIQGVTYNDDVRQAIAMAKEKGIPIATVHNHPEGYPPSVDDFDKSYDNNTVFGITVGHNGQVYKYENPHKSFGKEVADNTHFEIMGLSLYGADPDVTYREAFKKLGIDYDILKG